MYTVISKEKNLRTAPGDGRTGKQMSDCTHLVVVIEAGAVDDRADHVRDGLRQVPGDVERLPGMPCDLGEEVSRLLVQLRLQAHLAHAEVSQAAHREAAVFSPNLALREHDTCNGI